MLWRKATGNIDGVQCTNYLRNKKRSCFDRITRPIFMRCCIPDMDRLQVRQKTAAEMAAEEEELRREAEKMKDAGDGGGEDEFLRDFVANRRWLDPDAKETPR